MRHRRLSWIRSADRWLCARVDEPDDRVARGAVIVAPSFDREAVVSFRTTRALAARARRAGFVAYTFAWSGDADSSTLPEDGLLARVLLADMLPVWWLVGTATAAVAGAGLVLGVLELPRKD